ncbi:cell division and transport-associated protein TolR [Kushneria sinocarnis]|uniref:Tol-Pal system protein TolR n=1 Tax=Kushneria sinocarnis TaxID=595502 RepID=A0A420WYE3_9GAMM|nr:protein TolR [Kushneria sinocarnis]RKR06175.1 cell division and transport-associated protein TolR [Kushneria sinocarnis]
MSSPYRRKGRRKLASELNVVPFIDVMLVLLVIFMITAPMINQGVEVDLPQATSEPIQDDNKPLIVTVDQDGNYYISLGDREQTVDLDNIASQVKTVLSRNPDTPVMVRGDRNVSYGQVISLMGTLQGAGVPNVGLISDPPSGGQNQG